MPAMQTLVSRTELKEHFRLQGIDVSNRQLRYWQKQGILEKPIEESGKDAWYSEGAIPRVARILELLRRNFPIEKIKLELWKGGEEVNIRPLFEKALKKYEKSIIKPNEDQIYSSPEKRFTEKLIRQVRKRVGSQNVPTFVYLAQSLVSPQEIYPPTNKIDRELDQAIFEKGIGMELLKKKAGVEVPDVYTLLEEYRPILDPANLNKLLQNSSDQDLLRAHSEWKGLLEHLSATDRIIKEAHARLDKKPTKRRASLVETVQEASPIFQCLDTLVWLAIKQNPQLYAGILQNINVAKSLDIVKDNKPKDRVGPS